MMLSGYFCCFYLGNVMSIFSIAEGFSFLKHIFVFKVADIFQLLRDYYLLLLLFLPKYIYTLPRAATEIEIGQGMQGSTLHGFEDP